MDLGDRPTVSASSAAGTTDHDDSSHKNISIRLIPPPSSKSSTIGFLNEQNNQGLPLHDQQHQEEEAEDEKEQRPSILFVNQAPKSATNIQSSATAEEEPPNNINKTNEQHQPQQPTNNNINNNNNNIINNQSTNQQSFALSSTMTTNSGFPIKIDSNVRIDTINKRIIPLPSTLSSPASSSSSSSSSTSSTPPLTDVTRSDVMDDSTGRQANEALLGVEAMEEEEVKQSKEVIGLPMECWTKIIEAIGSVEDYQAIKCVSKFLLRACSMSRWGADELVVRIHSESRSSPAGRRRRHRGDRNEGLKRGKTAKYCQEFSLVNTVITDSKNLTTITIAQNSYMRQSISAVPSSMADLPTPGCFSTSHVAPADPAAAYLMTTLLQRRPTSQQTEEYELLVHDIFDEILASPMESKKFHRVDISLTSEVLSKRNGRLLSKVIRKHQKEIDTVVVYGEDTGKPGKGKPYQGFGFVLHSITSATPNLKILSLNHNVIYSYYSMLESFFKRGLLRVHTFVVFFNYCSWDNAEVFWHPWIQNVLLSPRSHLQRLCCVKNHQLYQYIRSSKPCGLGLLPSNEQQRDRRSVQGSESRTSDDGRNVQCQPTNNRCVLLNVSCIHEHYAEDHFDTYFDAIRGHCKAVRLNHVHSTHIITILIRLAANHLLSADNQHQTLRVICDDISYSMEYRWDFAEQMKQLIVEGDRLDSVRVHPFPNGPIIAFQKGSLRMTFDFRLKLRQPLLDNATAANAAATAAAATNQNHHLDQNRGLKRKSSDTEEEGGGGDYDDLSLHQL